MPYANEVCGIYRITNTKTNQCYVGQSQRVKKRLREHFRLLGTGKHPNARLQNAYNKYGSACFVGEIEVRCDDVSDLDTIEEAFISGRAEFTSPVVYNIADFAKAPMRGKFHSEQTRAKIRQGIKGVDWASPERRAALREGQLRRCLEDADLMRRVMYIVANKPNFSYAELGRRIGMDTSTVRKMFLRYNPIKDKLPWP